MRNRQHAIREVEAKKRKLKRVVIVAASKLTARDKEGWCWIREPLAITESEVTLVVSIST